MHPPIPIFKKSENPPPAEAPRTEVEEWADTWETPPAASNPQADAVFPDNVPEAAEVMTSPPGPQLDIDIWEAKIDSSK